MAARCHDILGLAPAYAVHQLGNFACNLYLKKKNKFLCAELNSKYFVLFHHIIFLQYFRKRHTKILRNDVFKLLKLFRFEFSEILTQV